MGIREINLTVARNMSNFLEVDVYSAKDALAAFRSAMKPFIRPPGEMPYFPLSHQAIFYVKSLDGVATHAVHAGALEPEPDLNLCTVSVLTRNDVGEEIIRLTSVGKLTEYETGVTNGND